MKKRYIAPALVSLAATVPAQAVELYGWTPSILFVSVNDPDGSVGTEAAASGLQASMAVSWRRDMRVWTEAYYQTVKIDPTTKNIGQSVTRYGISNSIQHRVRVSRGFQPWFGVGVDISTEKYEARHTIDEQGFLADQYSDRDENPIGLRLNVAHEWDISRNWDLGVSLNYLHPLDDGVTGYTLGVSILRKK